MSFQQGLTGLSSASKALDVIGNNVANAGTAGFKQSRIEFADVFAAAAGGSGGTQVGIGSKTAAVLQQFTQGNITASNNPLDVAINGQGFFRLSDTGAISFGRNGQFQVDKSGYLVTSSGLRVTGYGVDPTGAVVATWQDVQIPTTNIAPVATGASPAASGVAATLNLDSRSTPIAAAFDYTDPGTYTSSTSIAVYDSLGNAHTYSMYFVSSTAAPSTWDVYATLTTGADVVDLSGGGAGKLGTLAFTSAGIIDTATTTLPFSQTITAAQLDNGAADMVFDADFDATTQFGSGFTVGALTQDGFGSGEPAGFSISPDGMIQGRYTNGQSKTLGQLALVVFNNPQGLYSAGNGTWVETPSSGSPLANIPGEGSAGVLQSGALEDSNVDITSELVSMITAQRNYQANAQTIKTQDSLLQTMVNLR